LTLLYYAGRNEFDLTNQRSQGGLFRPIVCVKLDAHQTTLKGFSTEESFYGYT
jgi:hypothetical protein